MISKFEQIGVEKQRMAFDKEDALKSFSVSCNVCCTRGMFLKCDRCAINHAHQEVIACFEDLRVFKSRRSKPNA